VLPFWTSGAPRGALARQRFGGRASSQIIRQIEKDAMLAGRSVDDVVWHFVASARSGSMGADPRTLDALDDAGISYVFHLP
jgi:hypothetical protein